jgi:hypothetical protein
VLVHEPNLTDIERCAAPLLDEVSIGLEPGEDSGLRRHLVRLTDVIPPKTRGGDGEHRYCAGYRKMIQDPAWDAATQAPEFIEATRAAYASVYYLKSDHYRQDIVEQATAEALRLYTCCVCGNIRTTCPDCAPLNGSGDPPAKSKTLPYSVAGLKKLTVRICERLKKQDRHRAFTPKQHNDADDVPDEILQGDVRCGAARPNWNVVHRMESDIIAWIDADRGHVDLANGRLRRYLANLFTKEEVMRFVQKGLGYADLLARFRERQGMYIGPVLSV